MDIKKINWELHKKLYPKKLADEEWAGIIENDFNADIVDCFGHDMFDAGADTGMAIGLGIGMAVSLVELGVKIAKLIKAKRETRRLEQEYNKLKKEEEERLEKEEDAKNFEEWKADFEQKRAEAKRQEQAYLNSLKSKTAKAIADAGLDGWAANDICVHPKSEEWYDIDEDDD